MSVFAAHTLEGVQALAAQHHLPGLWLAAARGTASPALAAVAAQGAKTMSREAEPGADDWLLQPDTLFPVASVTKLATALAVLRLVAAGRLWLDDTLSGRLPQAAAAVKGVTLRTLLCHTSGLPNDVAPELAPYAHGLTWSALGRACLTTPLVRAPGSRVAYSNVGYGLLALVVERCTGLPFATALTGLVLDPLRIEGYLGVEPPRAAAHVVGNLGEHAGTDREPFNSLFWRSLAMPWAGLVTTVAGALALVRAFSGQPADFLPPDLRAEVISDQTHGLGGGFAGYVEWQPCAWGLGPEVLGTKAPHMAPPGASPASYGHSGYSGCLVWSDPQAGGGEGIAYAVLGGTRHARGWQTFWQPMGDLLLGAV